MVYCVELVAAFSTAARRNAVLNAINTRIDGKPKWGPVVAFATPVKAGPNGLIARMRFTSRMDANDLNDHVQDFASGARAPLAGSYLVVHDCSHDEGTDVCAVVARRDW